jgi:nicotinamidase-related amidase
MTYENYTIANTALLIVDPYNDFMTKDGKLFESTKESREKFHSFENMRKVIAHVRAAGIQVFIVPHHRATPGDIKAWRFPTPFQISSTERQAFAADSWGGRFNPDYGPQPGDVIVHEHFSQSGFAGTDLDLQLKQRGITHLVFIGMIANSCIETTAKYGVELGYHVTLVRDATAAFSLDGMHTAHEVNGPMFAQAIMTTEELLVALPKNSHLPRKALIALTSHSGPF